MDEEPTDSSKLPEQPSLFPPGEMPERPDLVQMVRKGVHKFTGERLSRDEELCRSVCADILLGLSGRAIARKYHISRSSVVSIEHVMRETGQITSVKAHVLELLSKVATVGLEEWLDALETGKIAPGQIPIPVLAALDKKAQLEAGIVLGTQRTERELSTDDLAAAWERAKAAGTAVEVEQRPVDSQSAGQTAEPQQIPQIAAPVAPLDNSWLQPTPVSRPDPVPDLVPAPAPIEAAHPSESREGGGGGRRARRGGPIADWFHRAGLALKDYAIAHI